MITNGIPEQGGRSASISGGSVLNHAESYFFLSRSSSASTQAHTLFIDKIIFSILILDQDITFSNVHAHTS